jgi:hypothetical protein
MAMGMCVMSKLSSLNLVDLACIDGMFAILIPVSLMPLIITLVWAELKAKKLGVVSAGKEEPSESILQRAWSTFEKLDVMGLLLIGTSVALILLPLTLSESAKGGWNNGTHVL